MHTKRNRTHHTWCHSASWRIRGSGRSCTCRAWSRCEADWSEPWAESVPWRWSGSTPGWTGTWEHKHTSCQSNTELLQSEITHCRVVGHLHWGQTLDSALHSQFEHSQVGLQVVGVFSGLCVHISLQRGQILRVIPVKMIYSLISVIICISDKWWALHSYWINMDLNDFCRAETELVSWLMNFKTLRHVAQAPTFSVWG